VRTGGPAGGGAGWGVGGGLGGGLEPSLSALLCYLPFVPSQHADSCCVLYDAGNLATLLMLETRYTVRILPCFKRKL
jgi:hypothetical protein